MFGGDSVPTLAIDRKEPIYDPLRAAIETIESKALADTGSLKPVRLDTDENGDVFWSSASERGALHDRCLDALQKELHC